MTWMRGKPTAALKSDRCLWKVFTVFTSSKKKKKNYLPTEDTQEQQTVPHLQVHSIICYTDVHNN